MLLHYDLTEKKMTIHNTIDFFPVQHIKNPRVDGKTRPLPPAMLYEAQPAASEQEEPSALDNWINKYVLNDRSGRFSSHLSQQLTQAKASPLGRRCEQLNHDVMNHLFLKHHWQTIRDMLQNNAVAMHKLHESFEELDWNYTFNEYEYNRDDVDDMDTLATSLFWLGMCEDHSDVVLDVIEDHLGL